MGHSGYSRAGKLAPSSHIITETVVTIVLSFFCLRLFKSNLTMTSLEERKLYTPHVCVMSCLNCSLIKRRGEKEKIISLISNVTEKMPFYNLCLI